MNKKLRKTPQNHTFSVSTIVVFFLSSILYMGSLLLALIIISSSFPLVFGVTATDFVYPNFTASNLQFVDRQGTFLVSRNGTFKASMFNPEGQQQNFYLCILHVSSNIVTWSANRGNSFSSSGKMSFTKTGIEITDQDGDVKWSTPPFNSPIFAMQLSDNGNLILLDRLNNTLWESFDFPTDTIVIGQKLRLGTDLSSTVTGGGFWVGNYKLFINPSDALLQWRNLTYWKLSMDDKAFPDKNDEVEYMAVNQTGLYLFSRNGSVIVIQVDLSLSDFRLAKLDDSGQFIVSSISNADSKQDFNGPSDKCQIPLICGRLGLCRETTASNNPLCSCPSSFHINSDHPNECVPTTKSYSLYISCNSTQNNSVRSFSFLQLGDGVDYFTNGFATPVTYGLNISSCRDTCSNDCSCLGFFYKNTSRTCFILKDELGSVISTSRNDRFGFVKVLTGSHLEDGNGKIGDKSRFPVVALVLLPFTGFSLLIVVIYLWWRKSKASKLGEVKFGSGNYNTGDMEVFLIPGLPKRFEYTELENATDNFKTLIGSGGFGAVYKGTLSDKSLVAVKKITNLGINGNKDFYTEIAIIGSIHHVNLVKLRGFCSQGRERLLVYEYMNRSSLDRTLFGNGPVLEWQERVDIALGTARGLAYLHSGCQNKIIHCDVKPENILLNDNSQAKISDFGLSKLLGPEQSGHFTTMRGTRGYLAPEWLTSSAISDKTDVYSFGMVLLEIVSGRKNCVKRTQSHSMDENNSGGAHSSSSSGSELVYFPLFALEMYEQERYLDIVDPRLEGRVTSDEVAKLVRVALCCVQEEPYLRPHMVSVVGMLEGEITAVKPRLNSLNFLRFYGRRFAEVSNIEENTAEGDFILYPQTNSSMKCRSTASYSFMSSQQVSGPR